MGMFLPAFFTGHLIQRFGIFNIMTAGIALLIGGVAIALLGTTEWHFRGALGLNGVGWNFMFVGATTLLTTTYRPAERGKAQAFNDFMVFGTTADGEPDGVRRARDEGLGLPELSRLRHGLHRLAGDRHLPPAQPDPRGLGSAVIPRPRPGDLADRQGPSPGSA